MIDFTYNPIILTDYKNRRETTSLRSVSLQRDFIVSMKTAISFRCSAFSYSADSDSADSAAGSGSSYFAVPVCFADFCYS